MLTCRRWKGLHTHKQRGDRICWPGIDLGQDFYFPRLSFLFFIFWQRSVFLEERLTSPRPQDRVSRWAPHNSGREDTTRRTGTEACASDMRSGTLICAAGRRARPDGPFGTIPGASDMYMACFASWYTWLRPKAASLGVGDLGSISSPLREVEIAPRSPTPRDAPAGRSHVYQRAVHATGISLAPGIVPKVPSRRARRPAAHRHQIPQSRLWEALAGCDVAVSGKQSGLTGRSTPIHDAYAWARAMGAAGSMRGDARVSGEYATTVRVW